jgi:hypothetical protein
MKPKLTAELLLAVSIVCLQLPPAISAGPANEAAFRSAWALCTQQKYAASADAFEALIRAATPNARLYYYAAVANRSANRTARAKQLADYVINNFPNTAESAQAQKMFPAAVAAAPAASGVPADLPDNLKNKSLEELMQTEEGRAALKAALKKPAAGAVSTASSGAGRSAPASKGARPFSAADIATDGAGGITEFGSNSDDTFACALATMASLPRGQRILAEMIRSDGPNSYVVRFPGDSLEHKLTPQKMELCGVKDKALWSTIIRCAHAMKAQANYTGTPEEALTWLTGRKGETVHPGNSTQQTITSFIQDALKSQSPIICVAGKYPDTAPELVEYGEAFTITAMDPNGMITMRNPHGANSRRFRLKPDHPEHKKFEQLNDGVFKMDISIFPRYFSDVARASL